MEALYRDLGRRLREARKASGMTQEQLGRQVGLSRVSITNVEGGRQQVYVHTLCRFAKALGIPPVDLVPDPALLVDRTQQAPRLSALSELPALHRSWVERVVTPGYPRRASRRGDRVADTTLRRRSPSRTS